MPLHFVCRANAAFEMNEIASLPLYLQRQEVAVLVDNPGGLITGWITMDDVMKVLMGARV